MVQSVDLVVEILFVVENLLVDLLHMFGLLDSVAGVNIVGMVVIENKLELDVDVAVYLVVDNNDSDEIDIKYFY